VLNVGMSEPGGDKPRQGHVPPLMGEEEPLTSHIHISSEPH